MVRRILARELRGQEGDTARVEAAASVLAKVTIALSRWFGPYGAVALVSRALVRAHVAHPSLRDMTAAGTPAAQFVGIADSVQRHGPAATADGILATLTILAEVISRLIGDDLASNLLEQSTTAVTETEPTTLPPHELADQATLDGSPARDAHQPVKES